MNKILVGALEYDVSDKGLLMKRRGKGLIKPFPDKDGYLRYHLTQGKNTLNVPVHRVVWLACNGSIPEGMSIDHIDGDIQNNCIDNLQLLTPEDNAVKGNAKHWMVVTPLGEELKVYNLKEFCRSLMLHDGHMYAVSKGQISHHKGWKCYEQD